MSSSRNSRFVELDSANHILLGDQIWMARFEGNGRATPALNSTLFGVFFLLALYLAIIGRCLWICYRAEDSFARLMGTAITFDCITADGRFIGGVIMPGIRTASDELVRRTAKLPATELTPPARVIGRRTEECIRAGVLWGTADAVDGIIRRIRAEWPTKGGPPPYVVATGGLAPLVAPLTQGIEAVQPDLTLVGLRLAATALGLGW